MHVPLHIKSLCYPFFLVALFSFRSILREVPATHSFASSSLPANIYSYPVADVRSPVSIHSLADARPPAYLTTFAGSHSALEAPPFAGNHLFVEALPFAGSHSSVDTPPFAEMEKEILRLVNQYRRSKRLAPLEINALESSVAEQHSRDMASGRTPFGHEGFNQRSAYLNKKMGPIRVVAENVASGQMSAREVVDGWLNSPGHRRNIEGNFRLTGIGLARGRQGMIYFTQIFTR